MPLFSLTASKIDRNVSIAVPVIAVINEMNYSHWISLKPSYLAENIANDHHILFQLCRPAFKRRLDCTTPTSIGTD